MITCLGLVVGLVESANPQDVANQCAKFIKTHRYLCGLDLNFEIDGKLYATVEDTHDFEDGRFGVLLRMYTGFMEVGIC